MSQPVDNMARLQRAHDDLKACAFRQTLAAEDLPVYVTQLWELSDAWSQVCYFTPRKPTEDQKLFRKFCSWLHDYNALTGRIRNHPYPLGYTLAKMYLPYFEAMLNVTHTYLDTGSMDVFYKPFINREAADALTGQSGGERWQLITKDLCGIDSPELPRYFPTTLPLCVDSEKMRNFYLNKMPGSWLNYDDTPEKRQAAFEDWEKNTKPICVWINEHLIAKSKQEGPDKAPSVYSSGKA